MTRGKNRFCNIFHHTFLLQLYDQVRQQCPENLKKIVTVGGDIIEENLALSNEDRQTVIDKVTVVFHCAATIKFDEDLR